MIGIVQKSLDQVHEAESITAIQQLNVVKTLPMRDSAVDKIKETAERDEKYQTIRKVVEEGWPEGKQKLPVEATEFFPFRHMITVEDGLLLKGDAIVVPESMRRELVRKLCFAHVAAEKVIERAKSCVFWPRMTEDIRNHSEHCRGCQTFPNTQRREPLTPHELAVRPWQKIGIDIAEWNGSKALVVVCYYSNLIMVNKLPKAPTTEAVKAVLERTFSEHGSCDQLVSDQDPLFRNSEFVDFLADWEVQHVKTSPHYHQSNGKVEAAVGIVKKIMRRATEVQQAWRKGLLTYNDTPQDKLGGATPGELFYSRKMRTWLPTRGKALKPELKHHREIMKARKRQVESYRRTYDRGARKLPKLKTGDSVWIKPTKLGERAWRPAMVTKVLKHNNFEISDGRRKLIRNRLHLKKAPARKEESQRREPREERQVTQEELGDFLETIHGTRVREERGDDMKESENEQGPEEEQQTDDEEEFESFHEETEGKEEEERLGPPTAKAEKRQDDKREKTIREGLRDRSKINRPDRYN